MHPTKISAPTCIANLKFRPLVMGLIFKPEAGQSTFRKTGYCEPSALNPEPNNLFGHRPFL